MPAAHTGYSVPIGSVIATKDVIVPAWVGYDIGCGMCAVPLQGVSKKQILDKSKNIFSAIYTAIPVGYKHNPTPTLGWWLPDKHSDIVNAELYKDALNQLGSLGSGNHFIEIGFDETDRCWIIIHSGSRNLGHKVCTHYMKLACGENKPKEGHFSLQTNSDVGKLYIQDLDFCLEFALCNRLEILHRVVTAIELQTNEKISYDIFDLINKNHNHAIETNGLWIHRKGATQAEKGMIGVIPGNMRDGSFIVEGLGNPDSLFSSSHGAGRRLGRKQAQRELNLSDFSNTMTGITAKVDADTLDEAPGAYKDIQEVMGLQKDLVKVLHHVKPLINIKG
jgi:tRNA-splicing ligase RtcB